MSSKPNFSAASRNAASMALVPRKRRGMSAPCVMPCLANSSMVVGMLENVLVSCENVPVTMRMALAPLLSRGPHTVGWNAILPEKLAEQPEEEAQTNAEENHGRNGRIE